MKEQIANLLETVREKSPLVHSITNYVTVNDVANIILAVGASPIMADDLREVEDITSLASALVINMGTLNSRTVESMILAGKTANSKGIPVVFDPVGAGASKFRNQTAFEIMKNVKVSILRGNLSEMSFMAGLEVSTKGVDTALGDQKNNPVSVGKNISRKFGCVSAITGAIDTITDGNRVIKIENGTSHSSKVTGTGCMSTGLVGCFAGVCEDMILSATAGLVAMGIAGEMAYEATFHKGTGSFHISIIDSVSKLDKKTILERTKLYE